MNKTLYTHGGQPMPPILEPDKKKGPLLDFDRKDDSQSKLASEGMDHLLNSARMLLPKMGG